jgi:hypothetical protein
MLRFGQRSRADRELTWNGAVHEALEKTNSIKYYNNEEEISVDDWPVSQHPEAIIEDLKPHDPRADFLFGYGVVNADSELFSNTEVEVYQKVETPSRNGATTEAVVIDTFHDRVPGLVGWNRAFISEERKDGFIPYFTKFESISYDETEHEFYELAENLPRNIVIRDNPYVNRVIDYSQDSYLTGCGRIRSNLSDPAEQFLHDSLGF